MRQALLLLFCFHASHALRQIPQRRRRLYRENIDNVIHSEMQASVVILSCRELLMAHTRPPHLASVTERARYEAVHYLASAGKADGEFDSSGVSVRFTISRTPTRNPTGTAQKRDIHPFFFFPAKLYRPRSQRPINPTAQ